MSACAPQGYEAMSGIAKDTVNDIACKSQTMETKLWDGLKTYLLEQKSMPSADALKAAFRDQVDTLAANNPQVSAEDVKRLNANLDKLVETLLVEAPKGERVETPDELLILLSAMDVGDQSTPFRAYMQSKVRGDLSALSKTIQTLDTNCPAGSSEENSSAGGVVGQPSPDSQEEPVSVDPATERDYAFHKEQALSRGENLATFGGRWAFSTAYQSCQSLQLPAMDARTPDVQGIAIVGTHPDGVGRKRSIASLSKVQSSHYYIKDMSSYGQSCFNVRQNPLIYDYGGKPYATTAADSPIDMFKNNGNGTSVLGIDCSGYVFSSYATAGLRLKAGRALKASDSWAWGSSSYVEPQNNGLTCLNKISVNSSSTMKAGDIVAVYGHVLLIDKVGADPFGIKNAKSAADCSKLSSDKFDFTVAQSSPSKEGIGLNYFDAKIYLSTSSKMKAGLEKYAYYTCLAKFDGKSYTPNVGTLSVVRHKGTAECMAPRVKMARESCIASCSSISR